MATTSIRTGSIRLVMVMVVFLLGGCATPAKPVPSVPAGQVVETFQSDIAISVSTAAGKLAGRGYLIFRQPDRFHVIILSPFGLPVFDLFLEGNRLTGVIPSRKSAWQGNLAELPDDNLLRGWENLPWALTFRQETGPPSERIVRTGRNGMPEIASFNDRGLLAGRENMQGDWVAYRDYADIQGFSLPREIEFGTLRGETVRIILDEPEINQPLDETSLTPSLEGVQVFPLADFRME